MITVPLCLFVSVCLLAGVLLGFVIILVCVLINDGPNNWEGGL